MPNQLKRVIDHRVIRISREEIYESLQFCHWIAANRGIGIDQRGMMSELIHTGALKKTRQHFSGYEPRKHLQHVERQKDGTWILSFNNGKRNWTLTSALSVRKK